MIGGEIGHSLVELKYLKHLDLRGNYFTRIPKFIASLKRLSHLDLPVNGAIPSHLGNLTKLQFLNLESGGGGGGDQLMTADNLEWLSHFPSLRFLKFYGANFTKASLQSFRMPPSLASLELLDCLFPQVDTSFPSYPNSSDSLTSLVMLDNTVHSTTINWLLNSSSNLVGLRLSNFMTGDASHFQLGKLTKLKFLDLDAQMIADNLEWLSHLSSLRHFTLHSSSSTNFAVRYPKIPPSLSSLELSGCQLLEIDILSSFYANSSNSLTTLQLYRNTIHSTVLTWLLNSSANLVNLTLHYNSIHGSLPNSFQKMNSLIHVEISSNDGLGNQIPKSLGNVTNLRKLVLSDINLTGTTPRDLDLGGNQLHGGLILEGDKTFPSLRELDLSYNLLEGFFPICLSRFPKLVILGLTGNRLTGPLPESIGELHNLESLDISSSSLSGVVSEVHFQKLSKLKFLYLSSNNLTLSFNSNWIPPFQLISLSLSSCKLGPQFPSWLHTQLNLSNLFISNSGISGAIPNWFSDLTIKLEYLLLSSNLMNGTFPNFPFTSNLIQVVDLSSNQFHGSIPPSLSNAIGLHLSNNKFSELKSFLCDQKDGATGFLDLSNNLLSGSLPDCWWNLKELGVLILESNELSGVIPGSIGLLYQIAHLNLRNNSFSGSLPSLLKNCTSLEVLDVGGNHLEGEIPTWIGESLTELVFLRLKSNRFLGSIPLNLCNLQLLQIIDLSLNHLSGEIPSCINNYTSMVQVTGDRDNYISVDFHVGSDGMSNSLTTALITWKGVEYTYKEILGLLRIVDLSCNRLIGEIPEELASLAELNQLNLSRNNLSGVIPKKIGMLSKIESLDLSHNKLSGKIPTSFAQVSTLDYLDLSDNQLSGRIPTSTQLQSFNASAYTGNLQLCGQPLTPTCPGDETSEGPMISDESYDDDDSGEWYDMSWLRMGIGAGFAVGFCGVCANLLLNTTWRLAYFRFLDGMGDWLYVIILVKWAKLKRSLST
ncbi:receptor-like protein EIX2 [Morus notabilis]|nr:receptor-like protein EIX2 [Morus notabilis]